MNWKPPHTAYERLITTLLSEVDSAYVVGGAVRDFLLNGTSPLADLDIVVADRAIPLARRVADRLGWAFYPMDIGRDVARLVFAPGHGTTLTCDISSWRGATIDDDLAARDFTVNAMAIRLRQGGQPMLLDPYGGRADLKAKILRRVSPMALSEDSVRLLRAVRLMVQLDLSIEAATYAQLERLSDTVRMGSAERIRDELWKMLATDQPHIAVELLDAFGLLRHVLPEVAATKGVSQTAPHYQDVFRHTLATVTWSSCLRNWLVKGQTPTGDYAQPELFGMLTPYRFDLQRHFSQDVASGHTRAQWLVWHALLHDIGKPSTAWYESTQGTDESSKPIPDGGDKETPAHASSVGPLRIRFLGHEEVGAELAASRLSCLRFSQLEASMCSAVVAAHMRPHNLHNSFPEGEISRRAAFRYYRDAGGRQFGRGLGIDTILLALADFLAVHRTPPADWSGYLAHMDQLLGDYFAINQESSTDVAPLLNGHLLQERLGIPESPLVGELLETILEAQAAGEVRTAEEALALARRLKQQLVEAK